MNPQDRFNTATHNSANGGDAEGISTQQMIQNLKDLAGELAAYAGYFVSAKVDGIKWSLTKLGMVVALGLVAALALAGMVVTGVVLLLVGMANGIGAIFGEELRWIGWLISGTLVLAVIFGGALLGMAMVKRSTARKTEQKYETKRERQQYEYGHDVRSRAADRSESVSAT